MVFVPGISLRSTRFLFYASDPNQTAGDCTFSEHAAVPAPPGSRVDRDLADDAGWLAGLRDPFPLEILIFFLSRYSLRGD